MSKKTETVKTAPVVEKPVVAEPQKHKWTRHIHNLTVPVCMRGHRFRSDMHWKAEHLPRLFRLQEEDRYEGR